MLQAAAAGSVKWLITTAALAQITAAGASPITPTWEAGKDTKVVTSIAAAQASPEGYKALLADIEKWSFTPSDEQANPVAAIAAICKIAHQRHEECIAAPALDLFGGSAAYLSSGVTGAAAFADVWELQSQTLELDVPGYRAFVAQASQQARAANPRITILAGLTTSNRIGNVTGPALWSALSSVRQIVHGYWANVPSQGPKCPTCGPPNPGPMIYVSKASLGPVAQPLPKVQQEVPTPGPQRGSVAPTGAGKSKKAGRTSAGQPPVARAGPITASQPKARRSPYRATLLAAAAAVAGVMAGVDPGLAD